MDDWYRTFPMGHEINPFFNSTNKGEYKELRKIKIAGYQVKVQESAHLLDNYNCFGEYSPTTQTIKLDARLTRQQKEETLMHELLEAINSIYDLNLDHDNQLCKLSVVLHQVIKDNKGLFDHMS